MVPDNVDPPDLRILNSLGRWVAGERSEASISMGRTSSTSGFERPVKEYVDLCDRGMKEDLELLTKGTATCTSIDLRLN